MIGSHRYVSKIEGARFTPTNLGLALICSYSRMGLELGKPYLRAAMEQECVAVAQGTKTCQAVVHDCIKEVGVSVVGVNVRTKGQSHRVVLCAAAVLRLEGGGCTNTHHSPHHG